MLIIAHRGLVSGPDKALENRPDQVMRALAFGFHAEIDAWFKDGRWWLGHDGPEHAVDWQFMGQPGLWIHCKNLQAFFKLRQDDGGHNYFWHESDAVVLTSKGYVWTYLGRADTASESSICVMPEVTYGLDQITDRVLPQEWYGICSDWAMKLREHYHA